MTFSEYLQTHNTEEGLAIMLIKDAASRHNDYRTLSLLFADLFRDKFEQLWWAYETELDRIQYEGGHGSGQVAAYDLIGMVLDDIRRKN